MSTAVFPDIEDLMCDLLEHWFNSEPVDLEVKTDLPEFKADSRDIDEGKVFIRVQRIGGQQRGRVLDAPVVEVTVLTHDRTTSRLWLEKIRSRLVGFHGDVPRPDGTVSTINRAGENKGPLRMPDMAPDKRRLNATFEIVTRLPRS